MSRYLAAHQGYHLSNDLVYINQLPLRSTLLEQQAGSADNFRGTGCVFDHSRRRFARLFHIGMIAVEPAQAGVGVRDSSGNRLIHFVRQGGRQLSHGGDTANVREVRLRLTQSLFGLLALGDVGGTANELHQIPGRVQNRMSDSVEVFYRATWKENSEFNFVIRLSAYRLIDCFPPPGSIIRMNAL